MIEKKEKRIVTFKFDSRSNSLITVDNSSISRAWKCADSNFDNLKFDSSW